MPRVMLLALFMLDVVLGFVSAEQVRSYTFTTMALPAANQNWPEAINDRGHVVGMALTPEGYTESFFYRGGMLSKIHLPTAQATLARASNTWGQIVGWYTEGTGPMSRAHGFLRSPEGRYTQLHAPFLDAWSTHPNAINKRGQIVGVYYETGRGLQGLSFLYENGVFSKLAVPKADITVAHGINDHGQIVGRYCCRATGNSGVTPYGAFLYEQGVFTMIEVPFEYPYPQSMRTEAYAINNHGDIIGAYQDPSVEPDANGGIEDKALGFLAIPIE